MNPLDMISNAVRAKEIATVLARHGFSDLLQHLDTHPGFLKKIVPHPKEKRTTWERMRLACEDLGPTFVKFGQLLSMRPDVIPEPLVFELRKLQDKVKQTPFTAMKAVAVDEIGKELDTVFLDFSETPAASASLAQVYFARLRKTGEEVAVKIQRPNIQKIVEADFDLITWFGRQLHQRVEALKPYDLPAIIEEVRKSLHEELDFENEARNLRFFNAQNPYKKTVFAPRVFGELTTPRVLVMERVAGTRIDQIQLSPEKARKIAFNGGRSLFHQVIISGFFHADPHGGNLSITEDGRLCFLDWGMTGQLTRHMRYTLADLFSAAVDHDAEKIVRLAILMSRTKRKINQKKMEKEVIFTLRETFDPEAGENAIGMTILRLFYIFGSNGIDVAQDYSLMAKAILSIEEAGKILDPNFDIRNVAPRLLRQLQWERWNPSTISRDAGMLINTGAELFKEFPAGFARILRRIEDDDITINFRHQGLDKMSDSVNVASNRLTLGVIIGSLLIGSSLIVTTGIQPYLFGYPALGIVGYILSAVLGLWVIIDIVRHGRHK